MYSAPVHVPAAVREHSAGKGNGCQGNHSAQGRICSLGALYTGDSLYYGFWDIRFWLSGAGLYLWRILNEKASEICGEMCAFSLHFVYMC